MKTAKGPGNLELRSIDDPRPKKDEVLIEVAAAGICGTDIHIKHDQTFYTPPVVLGHEYSGRVIETGSDVTEIVVGDLVVSPAKKRILGTSLANGAFAKYLAVPEYIIHKIPQGVNLEHAALAEPTACVVHSVIDTSPIMPGDVVVVQGPGTMGLIAAQVAKAMGAGKVIVTGVSADQWRFDIAKKLGVDVALNVQTDPDPVKTIRQETEGRGADVVIEASGACIACNQALDFVKVAGHVTLLGIRGRPLDIDLDAMAIKELTMSGTWGTLPSSWVTTLRLMASKQVDVAPLITHRISLEMWKNGFELMENQKAIKVLFTSFD
jgi:L-iditol 2-dehydrogenase